MEKRYPKLILALVIISAGAILGVILQDDLFFDLFLTFEGLEIFVPLALVIGFVAFGFVLVKRRIPKVLSYSLVISFSCVVALVVFEITGSLIDKWRVDAVISYVARAVPVLDQIKQKEGSYPAKLPIDLLGEPPDFLRLYGGYKTTGDTFSLEYDNEPAEWANGEGPVAFDSETRKWSVEDER